MIGSVLGKMEAALKDAPKLTTDQTKAVRFALYLQDFAKSDRKQAHGKDFHDLENLMDYLHLGNLQLVDMSFLQWQNEAKDEVSRKMENVRGWKLPEHVLRAIAVVHVPTGQYVLMRAKLKKMPDPTNEDDWGEVDRCLSLVKAKKSWGLPPSFGVSGELNRLAFDPKGQKLWIVNEVAHSQDESGKTSTYWPSRWGEWTEADEGKEGTDFSLGEEISAETEKNKALLEWAKGGSK